MSRIEYSIKYLQLIQRGINVYSNLYDALTDNGINIVPEGTVLVYSGKGFSIKFQLLISIVTDRCSKSSIAYYEPGSIVGGGDKVPTFYFKNLRFPNEYELLEYQIKKTV